MRKNFPDDKKVRKLKCEKNVRKLNFCDIKVYENALILALDFFVYALQTSISLPQHLHFLFN